MQALETGVGWNYIFPIFDCFEPISLPVHISSSVNIQGVVPGSSLEFVETLQSILILFSICKNSTQE